MPKVNAEYLNKKREKILEAAISVSKTKPLYEITMDDVIKASGISHGGIYRYYSNIDDLLVAVINQANVNADYKACVDSIISDSAKPGDAVEKLFDFLGGYMRDNMMTVGKISFELTVLCANHPEKQKSILPRLAENKSGEYFTEQLFRVIREGVMSGCFKPVLPEKDIDFFIMASIDGITRDTVLGSCYNLLENSSLEFDPVQLMNTLSKSVLLMLSSSGEND